MTYRRGPLVTVASSLHALGESRHSKKFGKLQFPDAYRDHHGEIAEPDEHIKLLWRTYDIELWHVGRYPAVRRRHYNNAENRRFMGMQLSQIENEERKRRHK